jgi:precorrin-4 methylase
MLNFEKKTQKIVQQIEIFVYATAILYMEILKEHQRMKKTNDILEKLKELMFVSELIQNLKLMIYI